MTTIIQLPKRPAPKYTIKTAAYEAEQKRIAEIDAWIAKAYPEPSK